MQTEDGRPPSRVIWEAGHYYKAKGPTVWSQAGWNILAELAKDDEARMLFIDDVHVLTDVHESERSLENIPFDPCPEPTHVVTEASVLKHSHQALAHLRTLPRRKRARKSGSGVWKCSGFPLTTFQGEPLCLFYDLGLSWHKYHLGFDRAVNIVPEFYESEQRQLLRLVKKALPSFRLDVILHTAQGEWRHLTTDVVTEEFA